MSRSKSLRQILSRPRVYPPTTRIPGRHLSTAPVSAADAAASLLSSFKDKTRAVTQVLDGNQLQKLSLTLNRRALHPGLDVAARTPPDGTVVPPGYHLVYFTPCGVEDELGADGTDVSYNAPAPFSRRMWAAGSMKWSGELRVGDEVTEKTRLLSATAKRRRDGGEMVHVEVAKEFWGPRGLALVDERSWIFRPEVKTTASPAAGKPLREAVIRGPSTVKDVPQDGAYPHRQLRWSPTGLFRFSALTFNAHKIHYDPAWSTAVEGHPGCVVHGPINLINMLDYWRDHYAAEGRRVQEIKYRAFSPIYAGETYSISAEAGDPRWKILVRKEGHTCMKGELLGE